MTNVTISISTSQIFRSWVAIFQRHPPMASLFRSLYDMPGIAPRMDVLSWGRRDFQIFSNRDTSRNAWNHHWGSLWSIRGSYQTIWSSPLTNVKWHSVTWPYTMTTPYWSDFVPNSTFYRILRGFHRTFAMGVACRQGILTPSGNLVLSHLGLHLFIKPKTHYLLVTFTEYDLFTEIYITELEKFQQNICNGCGMPAGDADSPWHLVPSLWDLHVFYLLSPIRLCSSNIPRYFLDFA